MTIDTEGRAKLSASASEDHRYYEGWESYYREDGQRAAWKTEPDAATLSLQARLAEQIDLHVADLGCGDGRNLWGWLAEGRRVVGIDIAPTALDHLREAAAAKGLRIPTLLVSDIADMTLAASQFDVVQCFDALPQTIDPSQVLAEMARIVKPGGLVVFNVFTPGDCAHGEGTEISPNAFLFNGTLFRFFEPDDLRALLPDTLEVLEEERRRWTDPPHGQFRPYPHEHEALYYLCRRRVTDRGERA